MVQVSVKLPDGSEEKIKMPVQLPHRVLKYLLCECGLRLQDKLVQKYWDHLESVQDDIALETKEFRRLVAAGTGEVCWPLGLHGDEANIGVINNPTNKVIGITLNLPLFRPKATRLARWLLFAIESDHVWSVEATLYPVLEVISDSLNDAIQNGVGGRRFLVTELRGDQAWIRYIFRHKAYWIGNNICYRCKACSKPTDLNYALNDMPGGWESTMRSTADFINEELEEPYCCYVLSTNSFYWIPPKKSKYLNCCLVPGGAFFTFNLNMLNS